MMHFPTFRAGWGRALCRLPAFALSLPSLAFGGVDWSVSVYGSASDAQIPVPPNVASCYGDQASGETSVVCGASLGGAAVSGGASAEATYGHLGISTSAVAGSSTERGLANLNSYATAMFSDTLQIDNPIESGVGILTFSLYLARNASLTAQVGDGRTGYSVGSSSATVRANFRSNDGYHSLGQADGMSAQSTSDGVVVQRDSSGDIDGASVPPGAALGYHVFSTQFYFNQPFQISLELIGISGASGDSTAASGSSILEAMHSLDWAGIQQVSVDGRTVDYSLWSESGTDWNQSFAPVPEPETWALLLAGLAFLGVAGRHRPRREG